MSDRATTTWYRNAGRRTRYHRINSTWAWTRLGIARCGASIPRPAYRLQSTEDNFALFRQAGRLCAKCARGIA